MYHLPRKQSAAQAGPRWVFFRSCLVTWNLSKLMVTVLKMDAGLEFTFCCSIPCSGLNQWQNRKRGWLLVAVELYVFKVFFLVQSPSFGMEVMKESRKKDCGVRSVFWFMENTEPICYQQENCRENDWLGDLPSFELANDEPQLSAKHCSQLAAYFGHTLGCRILSSFTLTHFTLTFKSE